MYCQINSGALLGVNALPVTVEVDIAPGMPMVNMVGSLASEVRESKERVWAALKNVDIPVPAAHITINLSPADIHKEGVAYDLPIAVGLLQSMGYFTVDATERTMFLGELGLNGELKAVRGVLPMVLEAARMGLAECIVPAKNAAEGAIVPGIKVRGADNILQVLEYLRTGEDTLLPAQVDSGAELFQQKVLEIPEDFADVKGQENAKRAAVIAAAGFHSLLMSGPPGAGKSMIAKRIPGILPPLTLEESLEVTGIYSVAGLLPTDTPLILHRTFQSPHHTLSRTALIGGGSNPPRPGAISLAHRSVLFLDELTEFSRATLDSLRQPLEDHEIRIARANFTLTYPADFLLVCAMNPCPCGFYPDHNRCQCTEPMIRRYLGKISGPILDRIDLCVEIKAVGLSEIRGKTGSLSSAEMRAAVERARKMQEERYRGTSYRFNAELKAQDLDRYCHLGKEETAYMESIYQKLKLSARSYHRLLRVARTIADLAKSPEIKKEHLLEAVCFRPDQGYWQV
jgi:magnesium chelatase family protein